MKFIILFCLLSFISSLAEGKKLSKRALCLKRGTLVNSDLNISPIAIFSFTTEDCCSKKVAPGKICTHKVNGKTRVIWSNNCGITEKTDGPFDLCY